MCQHGARHLLLACQVRPGRIPVGRPHSDLDNPLAVTLLGRAQRAPVVHGTWSADSGGNDRPTRRVSLRPYGEGGISVSPGATARRGRASAFGDVHAAARHHEHHALLDQYADGPTNGGTCQLVLIGQALLAGDRATRRPVATINPRFEDGYQLTVRRQGRLWVDSGIRVHAPTLVDQLRADSCRYVQIRIGTYRYVALPLVRRIETCDPKAKDGTRSPG